MIAVPKIGYPRKILTSETVISQSPKQHAIPTQTPKTTPDPSIVLSSRASSRWQSTIHSKPNGTSDPDFCVTCHITRVPCVQWGGEGSFFGCLSIVMGTFGQVYFSFVQTFSSFCRVAFLFLGLEDRRHLRLQVVTVRVRTKSSGSTPRIQALSGVSNHSRLRFSCLPPSEVGIRDSLTSNSDLSPWTVKRPIICSIAVKAEIGRRPADKGPVENKAKNQG
jgi:hypothetical protein